MGRRNQCERYVDSRSLVFLLFSLVSAYTLGESRGSHLPSCAVLQTQRRAQSDTSQRQNSQDPRYFFSSPKVIWVPQERGLSIVFLCQTEEQGRESMGKREPEWRERLKEEQRSSAQRRKPHFLDTLGHLSNPKKRPLNFVFCQTKEQGRESMGKRNPNGRPSSKRTKVLGKEPQVLRSGE